MTLSFVILTAWYVYDVNVERNRPTKSRCHPNKVLQPFLGIERAHFSRIFRTRVGDSLGGRTLSGICTVSVLFGKRFSTPH